MGASNLASEDYYEILGVPRNATQQDIKSAYRKLTRVHHPDVNPEDREGASERFKKIGQAYECLSDEKERKLYDQFGKNYKNGVPGGPSMNINPEDLQNLLGRMFGGSAGGMNGFNFSSGGMPGGFSFSSNNASGPGMQGFNFTSGGMPQGMGGAMPQGMGGGMPFGFGDIFNGFTSQGFSTNNNNSNGFPGSNQQRTMQPPLPKGTRVYLYGLNDESFNGREGEIEGFNGTRFVVNVKGKGQVKLKPQNICQSVGLRVHSLSHVNLNGLFVESVGYTYDCERIRCKFPNGQVKNIKPVNLEIPQGTIVRIQNLQNASVAKLNGQFARIRTYSRQTGRYEIEMLKVNKTYKVRPENVQL